MPEWSQVDWAHMLADASRTLATQESLAKTAEEIVALAVSVVPGADAAGISRTTNGDVESLAATDQLASDTDAAQHQTGQGPCLESVWQDRLHQINDMATETRWPAFTERAKALGVGSLLACHLSSERGIRSALNLYAREPNAFDEHSRRIALIYATHATIALESARLEADLRGAVESRQGIGQAVGIMMERHLLTAKQAFDLLVRTSQGLNVKLRDLAEIVVSTGVDPGNTLDLARIAGQEAGSRAIELHQELRLPVDKIRGSSPAQIAAAARRARSAKVRATSSRQRAIDAKHAEAEAHDRAAELLEKQAAAGRANAAEHDHQAQLHREAARQARAAATAPQDQRP